MGRKGNKPDGMTDGEYQESLALLERMGLVDTKSGRPRLTKNGQNVVDSASVVIDSVGKKG